MKNTSEIKYIELKSGFGDDGPAWIGQVSFSKSGRTIYFNGRAFQSLDGTGIGANYVDIENGDEYWISGVKKNLQDRHQCGGGKITVENRIKDQYLSLVGLNTLSDKYHESGDLIEGTPKERINELENEQKENLDYSELRFKEPNELTNDELNIVIKELHSLEEETKYNKARRSMKSARVQYQVELDKRNG